jgi:hypothetical protein
MHNSKRSIQSRINLFRYDEHAARYGKLLNFGEVNGKDSANRFRSATKQHSEMGTSGRKRKQIELFDPTPPSGLGPRPQRRQLLPSTSTDFVYGDDLSESDEDGIESDAETQSSDNCNHQEHERDEGTNQVRWRDHEQQHEQETSHHHNEHHT